MFTFRVKAFQVLSLPLETGDVLSAFEIWQTIFRGWGEGLTTQPGAPDTCSHRPCQWLLLGPRGLPSASSSRKSPKLQPRRLSEPVLKEALREEQQETRGSLLSQFQERGGIQCSPKPAGVAWAGL